MKENAKKIIVETININTAFQLLFLFSGLVGLRFSFIHSVIPRMVKLPCLIGENERDKKNEGGTCQRYENYLCFISTKVELLTFFQVKQIFI